MENTRVENKYLETNFKFDPEKPIGVGGFGKVFRIIDNKDGKAYALKYFGMLENDDERESTIFQTIPDHENVVRYYKSWLEKPTGKYNNHYIQFGHEKYVFIQMEYCVGGDLRNWLNCERRKTCLKSTLEADNIFRQILKAVAHIHGLRAGPIIHRDIKPENIFLAKSGGSLIAKLGDFGLAREINQINMTSRVGTSYYRAPELRKRGQGTYNQKVDIYSLGRVYYELHSDIRMNTEEERRLWDFEMENLDNLDSSGNFGTLSNYKVEILKSMLAVNPDSRPNAADIHPEIQEIVIGIDFGESNCCISVIRNGIVQMIPDGKDFYSKQILTPSYVLFKENNDPEVGEWAKRHANTYSEETIFDLRRLIGRKFYEYEFQKDISRWPFQVVNCQNEPKIKVGEKTFFPENIAAEIIKKLMDDAFRFLYCRVETAVITVPSYFSNSQIQATNDVGLLAGLKKPLILKEPTAAAIAYGLHETDKALRHVVVYNLGTQTLDVTVLRVTRDDITILSSRLEDNLGGENFTNKLIDLCVAKFFEDTKINLREDKSFGAFRRLQRIRYLCESIKIGLSQITKEERTLDGIYGEFDLHMTITRDKFNEINHFYFNKTIDFVKRTLWGARLKPEHIDDIILVGGSTRIPKIQEMLQNLFPYKSIHCSINVQEVVARGAAVAAAWVNKSEINKKKLDYSNLIKAKSNQRDVVYHNISILE